MALIAFIALVAYVASTTPDIRARRQRAGIRTPRHPRGADQVAVEKPETSAGWPSESVCPASCRSRTRLTTISTISPTEPASRAS